MSESRATAVSALPFLLGLLLIGFGLGYLFSQGGDATPTPPATPLAGVNLLVLPEPRTLSGFALRQHDGRPFTPDTLRGRWNVLFFGYTHCPDVCPLALQNLRLAWQQLAANGSEARLPRVWFVSVDPDRDNLKLLGEYVTYFDPRFVGVTGDADDIDALTRQLGILYGFEDKQGDDYAVNHSAQLVFVGPRGRLRAVLSPPFGGDEIVKAVRYLQRLDPVQAGAQPPHRTPTESPT